MAEGSTSAATVYRARPTLRLAGREDARLSTLLLTMRMEESEGGMSSLELRLSNWASAEDGSADFAFGAGAALKLGAVIQVYVGDETQPRELFKGRITALEGDFVGHAPPELVVLAEDALMSARLARHSRTFADATPADVARTIASELGLQPVITGCDAPSGTWAQFNESNLAFLRRLLQRIDADLQIVGDELQISPRGEVQRGSLELAYGSQLLSARVVADLADQVTGISTRGWNPQSGSAVQARITRGTQIGPGAGTDGASTLREAFGERSEHLGHVSVATDAEAEAVATAAFDLRARRDVRVDGRTEGKALLRVGTRVRLSRLAPQFCNTYYIARTRHLYDQREGYRTEFGGECAYLAS
ncbi:MAG: phage late control D family protein [Nevskia sp.]